MKLPETKYLWVWENVFLEYNYGIAFAIASSKEEAIKLVCQSLGKHAKKDLESKEPEKHLLNENYGNGIWGGT